MNRKVKVTVPIKITKDKKYCLMACPNISLDARCKLFGKALLRIAPAGSKGIVYRHKKCIENETV